MDNPTPNSPPRVAVIGGGIAGLATAYTLQEQARTQNLPLSITLLESSPRLGGKILTEQSGGFTLEGGPDSFLLQKPWAAQMAQALGLEADLMGTNPDQKRLFVVNRGRLVPMPDGVMLIIPTRFLPFITTRLISWPGKLRMGLDLLIPRRADDADESIGHFIRRRLGREALEKIAQPMMSGIHVSDAERQSLLGTFPRFRAMEKQYGSLIRGMLAQRRARKNGAAQPDPRSWKSSVFVSLRGGMGQLVLALESALSGVEVRRGCPAVEVRALEGSRYPPTEGYPPMEGFQVIMADGEALEVDALVVATPAFVTAQLVHRLAPELSGALSAIRYVTTATVSLAYHQADLERAPKGIGFIVPRKENRRISACTMTSVKFAQRAPENLMLLRCFVGGPGQEELVDQADEKIIADARAELAALANIQAEPVLARVFRWPRGNPQYDVGHLDRVKEMHRLCPGGLFLAGSSYEGVGIPDCVHQGQQAAEKVLAYLRARG